MFVPPNRSRMFTDQIFLSGFGFKTGDASVRVEMIQLPVVERDRAARPRIRLQPRRPVGSAPDVATRQIQGKNVQLIAPVAREKNPFTDNDRGRLAAPEIGAGPKEFRPTFRPLRQQARFRANTVALRPAPLRPVRSSDGQQRNKPSERTEQAVKRAIHGAESLAREAAKSIGGNRGHKHCHVTQASCLRVRAACLPPESKLPTRFKPQRHEN
jgi:hypothetical protein